METGASGPGYSRGAERLSERFVSGSIPFCLNVDPFPIPCPNPVANPMPSSGSESTSLSSTDPTPSVSGAEGALPTSPGCNLGNPPGNILRVLKTRRIVSVSRTSTTAFLMRCAFRIGRCAYGMDGMATSGVVSAV